MNAATAHAIQDALRKAFHDRDRATEDVQNSLETYEAAVARRQAASTRVDELVSDAVALGIDITYQPTRTTSNIADNSRTAGVGRF